MHRVNFVRYLLIFLVVWLPQYVGAKSIAEFLVEDDSRLTAQEAYQQPESSITTSKIASNTHPIINIKIVELTDNSGHRYIGAQVNSAVLLQYLTQMELMLNDDFSLYRQNQATRDHHTFHLTVINPNEYQLLKSEQLVLGKMISVTLYGLGTVRSDNKETYYVVAESAEVQLYRQQLLLPHKDLHITLGFNPQDVYGVSKDLSTLIN